MPVSLVFKCEDGVETLSKSIISISIFFNAGNYQERKKNTTFRRVEYCFQEKGNNESCGTIE